MQKSKVEAFTRVLPVLVLVGFITFSNPLAQAAEKEGGFGAGLKDAISNFQQSLPSIFHELSAEDIGVKPRLRPHFGVNSSFTSDANLGEKQGDPAWLARISSGVALELPLGDRLYTEADYTFSWATIRGRETNEHVMSHSIDFLARYKLTDESTIGLSQNLQLSEVPGAGGDTFILNSSKIEGSHKFSPLIRASVDATYQHFQDKGNNTIRTKNSEFMDFSTGVSVDYKATDMLTLIPSFRWTLRDFKAANTKDFWGLESKLGAKYDLSARTTISAHVGWDRRDFDDTDARGDEVDHSLLWGVSISHAVSRLLTAGVSYDRSVQDTFLTDFAFDDTGIYRDGAEATNLDNLDRNFRIITIDNISARGTYHIDERNSMGIFGAFQFSHTDAEDNIFNLVENDEKVMELGASYSYRLNRYISLGIQYIYGRRFSNEDSLAARGNYTFHKAGGGLTIAI